MKLLNLSNLPWVPNRLKRNQAVFTHLLDSLPQMDGGVFVNPPRLAGEGIAKYAAPLRYSRQITQTPGGKPIAVIDSTYTLWDWHLAPIRGIRSIRMAFWLRQTALSGNPYILWLNTAGRLQTPLALRLKQTAAQTCFDWSDDFRAAGFGMNSADLDKLTQTVDRVLCVNDSVAGFIDHPKKKVFNNCTDPAAFAKWDPAFRLSPWWPKPPGAIYIGFTGGIHWTRTDLPLLEEILRRFPAYRFLFIGYTDGPRIREWLTRFSNAVFVEEIPYRDLTHVIHSFDAAIIPHADNEYTRGNDLLKVLEYFACGVPVVSTPCSGLERYGGALHIVPSACEFGDRIEAIVNGSLAHDSARGLRIAQERSWPSQVAALADWVVAA